MDKLEFLSRYRQDVHPVSVSDVRLQLPVEWADAFEADDFTARKQSVIGIWKKYCGKELSNTISYISDNLVDINLLSTSHGISALYELKRMDGGVDYYEGLVCREDYDKAFDKWNCLPKSLRNFYENVHNGFYYYASMNMGILPIEQVFCLADYDWGIIEDLGLEIPFNMDTAYSFFASGGGGYVVLDTSEPESENCTVWFADDKPLYNKNFWDFVDEWIVIGFE